MYLSDVFKRPDIKRKKLQCQGLKMVTTINIFQGAISKLESPVL